MTRSATGAPVTVMLLRPQTFWPDAAEVGGQPLRRSLSQSQCQHQKLSLSLRLSLSQNLSRGRAWGSQTRGLKSSAGPLVGSPELPYEGTDYEAPISEEREKPTGPTGTGMLPTPDGRTDLL